MNARQLKRALLACQVGPLPIATARLYLCCRALQRLLHTHHVQAEFNFGVRIDIDIGVIGPRFTVSVNIVLLGIRMHVR